MDARKLAVNAMVRVLSRSNLNVSAAIKAEMALALQKYTVTRDEPVKGDMLCHIGHFLNARAVDGLAPRTIKNYKEQLLIFAKHVDRYPSRIKTNHIRDYIAYLSRERQLKTSTIVTTINILRTFFGWMHAEEIIEKNPMAKIKTLKLDKKNLRHSLSEEEIEQMRNCCITSRERAMFELFYSSGCRLSELAGINLSDINFQERSIRVRGKGSKQRTVYFSIKAKLYIEQYLERRPAKRDALFIHCVSPYERLGVRAIQNEIKQLGEEASIKTSVFPHILRHSFASHALNRGMSLDGIQKLMGHDNPNTTQIYAKMSGGVVKGEYDRLSF